MNLRDDHSPLPDALATRRYFAKFERIIRHLHEVHDQTAYARHLYAADYVSIIGDRLTSLARSFKALSYKHLMAKHVMGALPHELEIDLQDSGFPVFRELLQMANDLTQAGYHLDTMPEARILKQEMVEHILRERTPPRSLQFALSQRIYYETLTSGVLFQTQNHPEILQQNSNPNGDRRFLIHWAAYDTRDNLPVLYFMEVDESGDHPLSRDERRWPRVQSHLQAQSLNSLKLVTIARGFDEDFHDIHPKSLTRVQIGPMYSNTFTQQNGPLRDILAEANGKPGQDWALGWTVETLTSARTQRQSAGIFGTVRREIYQLDQYAAADRDTGATSVTQALILPQRQYQILVDRKPPGLKSVRFFVVGADGHVLAR